MMYCIVRNIENVDHSFTKMYYAGIDQKMHLPGWTIAEHYDIVYKYASRAEARKALAELLAKYTNYIMGAYIVEYHLNE